MHPLLTLARLTGRHLANVEVRASEPGADRALRDRFVADLLGLRDLGANDRPPSGGVVRGLRHAPAALGSISTSASEGKLERQLVHAARDAFGHVRWSEFYAPDPWSAAFLPEFANGEGIGPDGALRCDTLILGLFVLGPDTLYPTHAHPAEEFYLCLSGTPSFQIGVGEPFHPLDPGQVAWHGSNVSHAICTGHEPFMAVFGWRGAIGERSWYRDDMADPSLPIRYPTIAKA